MSLNVEGGADQGSKRLRVPFATFDEYAKDVLERGGVFEDDGFEDVQIVEDVAEELDGYSDIIDRIVNEVDEALNGLDVNSKVRTAVILMRWLCEQHCGNSPFSMIVYSASCYWGTAPRHTLTAFTSPYTVFGGGK